MKGVTYAVGQAHPSGCFLGICFPHHIFAFGIDFTGNAVAFGFTTVNRMIWVAVWRAGITGVAISMPLMLAIDGHGKIHGERQLGFVPVEIRFDIL